MARSFPSISPRPLLPVSEIPGIIKRLTDYYAAEFDLAPSEINRGWCKYFATAIGWSLGVRWPADHVVWLSEATLNQPNAWKVSESGRISDHAVFFYQGKYYDSETPNGVVDPRQLPAWYFRYHPTHYLMAKYAMGQLMPTHRYPDWLKA